MFTGIISSTAKVMSTRLSKEGMVLQISKPQNWRVKPGRSIAVNGVCSTVINVTENDIAFEYMLETLSRTNLNELDNKKIVNLEQSIKASDRLDGHIVQGHIDTVGKITSIKKQGNSLVFSIEVKDYKSIRLVAQKGAIAVDGISLTVVSVVQSSFTVKIISYTLEHTNLSTKKVGDTVNLEFDILAKYIQRLLSKT